MKKTQIQLEVCKALLNPNSFVRGEWITKEEFAVTTNGYVAFVFNKSEIIFDTHRVPPANLSKQFNDNKLDTKLKRTNKMFCLQQAHKVKTIVQYDCAGQIIYIDEKLAKPFLDFSLYAHSPNSRILAKDNFNNLVGLFMPINYVKSFEK